MPHSQHDSISSNDTFDLPDEGPQPESQVARVSPVEHASDSYGVAVTSSPRVEGKARFALSPQQELQLQRKQQQQEQMQKESQIQSQKRNSMLVPDAYESHMEKNGHRMEPAYSDATAEAESNGNSVPEVRVQQHQDEFGSSAREKILRSSPIIAELKTNVIIKDEFTLVTDLSYHLAQRYSRPESCVIIKVDHSACLALGGGFEPCYILNISAIAAQVGPSINRRNAALIQSFMAEILSVPPERGVIKFEAVPEECYAMCGATVRSELDRLDTLERLQRPSDLRRPGANPHRKSFPSSYAYRQFDNRASIFAEEAEDNRPRFMATVNSDRPSTSHGTTEASALSGVRLSSVSAEDLSTERVDMSDRPLRSFGGDRTSSSADAVSERQQQQHVSQMSHQATQTDREHPPRSSSQLSQDGKQSDSEPSHQTKPAEKEPPRSTSQLSQHPKPSSKSRPQPLKSSLRTSSNTLAKPQQPAAVSSSSSSINSLSKPATITSPPTSPGRTTSGIPAEIRLKHTHLENLSTLRKKFEPSPEDEQKPAPQSDLSALSASKGKDTTANTAKRRATLTSSAAGTGAEESVKPSLPSIITSTTLLSPKGPVAPPIPPSPTDTGFKSRTRSLRSFRLGGRRNIFSAIRNTFRDDAGAKVEN